MIKCTRVVSLEDTNKIGDVSCKFLKGREYLLCFKEDVVVYDENLNGIHLHMPTPCLCGISTKCIDEFFLVKDEIFYVKNQHDLTRKIKALDFDRYLLEDNEIFDLMNSRNIVNRYERKYEIIAHVVERIYLVKYKDDYFLMADPLCGRYEILEDTQDLQELINNCDYYKKEYIEVYNEKEWNNYIKNNNIKL